ncbi:MAG: hypothetical protein LH481_09610 [Burkholderiales bacterium]|nr:hypothetical protein [Burkholderiales bacterium]
MKRYSLMAFVWFFMSAAHAAPVVLMDAPVRVVAETLVGPTPDKLRLEISVRHGASEFVLNVLQRGTSTEALAAQKAASGWKDGYLFIRDDCLSDDAASTIWRCVVDHVFTLAEDAKDKARVKLIYVGDVYAGEECIQAARIGCALYKGAFTDIYDRLENNTLAPRSESPALLIESTVESGVFAVDIAETWKANQERFLSGTKCLQAKPETQKERCIDGITPRRAYLFNTALTTYTRQEEQLIRTRSFARAALCENGRERLTDTECGEALRTAAMLFANIKPGDKARARGNVLSPTVRQK